jgi:hypothetical protein
MIEVIRQIVLQRSGHLHHLKVSSAGYMGAAVFFSDLDSTGWYSRAMEKSVVSSHLGGIKIAPTFGPPYLPFVVIQAHVGGTDSLTRVSAPFIRFRAPAGVYFKAPKGRLQGITPCLHQLRILVATSRPRLPKGVSPLMLVLKSPMVICRNTNDSRKCNKLAHHPSVPDGQ